MQPLPALYLVGASVLDGTGAPPRRATVAVQNGRIAAVQSPEVPLPRGARTLKLDGLALAPGFIDIHAHGDIEPLVVRRAESRVFNGVTTEVCGNCGSTPFPILDHMPGYLLEKGRRLKVEVDWKSAAGYFSRIEERGASINRLFLVGHGRIRAAVTGAQARTSTLGERARMAYLVEEAMEQGAWGVSSGLMYAPGCHANAAELAELCKVVARRGGYYATHLRSEAEQIFAAIEEAAESVRQSGARLQISHLKLSGQPNWRYVDELERRLEELRAQGIELGADWYPYEAWNANLDAILPDWVYEGGTSKLLDRLRNPQVRRRLAKHVVRASRQGMPWNRVIVGTVTLPDHRRFQGRSIAEISRELNLSPEDTYFYLILAEGGRAEGMIATMHARVQARLFRLPFVAVGSDATARPFEGPAAFGQHHPRTYGTATRVLRLCREEKLLPFPEAIRRMTSLPAKQIGLAGRGLVKRGFAADLVVFDPFSAADTATYKHPRRKPAGIRHVLVNGVFVVRDGEHTGATPGRLLRKQS